MLSDEELITAKEKEDVFKRERESALQQIDSAKKRLLDKTGFEKGMWNVQTIGEEGLGCQSTLSHLIVPPSDLDDEPRRRAPVVMGLENVADVGTLHEKLMVLWSQLQMSVVDRMSIMVKYSSKTFLESVINAFQENSSAEGPLYAILFLWEGVVKAILEREDCLARLEEFERVASDPTRYFVKVCGCILFLRRRMLMLFAWHFSTHSFSTVTLPQLLMFKLLSLLFYLASSAFSWFIFQGDAAAASNRLAEARNRARLQRELKSISARVTVFLDKIQQRLGDQVIFAGRTYRYRRLCR